jgi:hypothetical protein
MTLNRLSSNLLIILPSHPITVRTAHKQSEQRSEQDAPAQEAAMMPMIMPVMAVAMMATEDHTAKRQDTKQTQHFSKLSVSSFCVCSPSGTCT